MDESEFTRQIGLAWALFRDTLGIGRSLICRVSLRVDEVFRDVALSEDSSYEEIYKTGLSRSHYNIILYDYAYFQFGRRDDSAWRLGYFPNPWLTGVPLAEDQLRHWEAMEEIGALASEAVGDLLGEMPYRAAVPPVRFEIAPDQYQELSHPAAHFHIGRHAENRWPSATALGPLAFSLYMAKMYYSNAWARHSTYYGASVADCLDEKFLAVISDTRPVHDFSAKERRALHFGKSIPPVTSLSA